MPTIEDNKKIWNSNIVWKTGGKEWSSAWGGTPMQWYGSVFPRIRRFLPADNVLEIGPGFGRLTEYLKEYARHLIVVDISEKCIDECKKQFTNDKHLEFYVNDGKSLDMIEDNSIDFIFSHDALTFAEAPELNEYIRQISRKLKKNGVAYIHHSNLESYWYYRKLSQRYIKTLRKLKLIEDDYWRAYSVSARRLREMCNEVNLECITQELTNFFTKKTYVDCFSLIVHKDSEWYRKPRLFRNDSYMDEARYLSRLSRYYDEERRSGYKSITITYDTVNKLDELE